MKITPLSIADMSIVIKQEDSPGRLRLPASFDAFIDDKALDSPDIIVDWRESSDFLPVHKDRFLYDINLICNLYYYPERSRYVVDVHDSSGYWPRSQMTAATDWSYAELLEEPVDTEWVDDAYFGTGELLIRSRLPYNNGAFFHASGIDDNGKGIIFVAFSGTGKSTQAEIWSKEPGVTLINHDRMAAVIKGEEAVAYGIPWGGSGGITLNHSVPLRAIILLEQAPVNELIPLKPVEALTHLMTCTFISYWSQPDTERLVGVLEGIIMRTPVFRLRCRPEPAVIPLVRSAI